MTLSEILPLYDEHLSCGRHAKSTRTKYRNKIKDLIGLIGDKEVTSVTEMDLSSFVNEAIQTKWQTKCMRLKAVRSLFKFMRGRNYITSFVDTLVVVDHRLLSPAQLEPGHRVAFTDEELDLLLMYCTGRFLFMKYAITIARETGLRIKEVLDMKWSQVGSESLIIFTVKSRKRVPVNMSPALIRLFATFPERPPLQVVIDSMNKGIELPVFGAWIEHRIKVHPAWGCERFSALCKKAGISGKTFHCIRHYFAAKCRRLGVEPDHLRSMMAHSSMTTTNMYGKTFLLEKDHPLNFMK